MVAIESGYSTPTRNRAAERLASSTPAATALEGEATIVGCNSPAGSTPVASAYKA